VRQFRLTREALRLGIALVLLAIAGLTSLTAAYVVSEGGARADERLAAKAQLLESELQGLHSLVDTLQLSLDDLARKDEFYRLLAGLEPLDGDVLMAGIGGPDADHVEARPLFSVDQRAARRTFTTASQLNSLIRRARVLSLSWREAEDTLSAKHARLRATPSIYPTRGYVSSSFTNARWHPSLDRPRPHTGIDIVAPHGTPIVASARGRVSSVGHQGEYGLLVDIDHGYGVVTRYAHLSRAAVRVGQAVERGQHIGNVGQSGLATGPHLHYEVLVHGQPTNPRRYILDAGVIRN
jgi:murein DD-endopeptidase MepM/ murein hydrolase activator NlpD